MTENNELCISDKQGIEEIKSIQKYIKSKKETSTETEVVRACIRVAKRLSAENWGIYLEVKHMHEKENDQRRKTLV